MGVLIIRILILALSLVFLFPVPVMASDNNDYITVYNRVHEAISELKEMLPEWHDNLKPGEFDCSESSAFLQGYLQYRGIECEIVVAYSKNYENCHAWVEVPYNHGVIPLEPTVLVDDPFSNCWLRKCYPNRLYPSLFFQSEWDWWNNDYLQSKKDEYDWLQNLFKEKGNIESVYGFPVLQALN
jgi:hypothetical protein